MANGPIVSSKNIASTINEAVAHLEENRKRRGGGAYVSIHESLGIITEEFWETVEAVRSNRLEDVEEELQDVVTACLWAIASMKQNYNKESFDVDDARTDALADTKA